MPQARTPSNIESRYPNKLLELIDTWEPLGDEDAFPEIEDPPPRSMEFGEPDSDRSTTQKD